MKFSDLIESIACKFGDSALDPRASQICIPVPALSTRYLLQNEGFFLGKIVHLVGEEASFKSTFALELARWHLNALGYGIIFETETRPVHDIQKAILKDEDRYWCFSCTSLDQWQLGILQAIKTFNESSEHYPLCIVVDSLLGCNAEDTIKRHEEEGALSARFSTESRAIADFLRSNVNKLLGTLITLCFVNHKKVRQAAGAYWAAPPVVTSLGGSEPRFYASYEFLLSRASESRTSINSLYNHEVSFRVQKNTFGIQDFELRCPIKFITKDGCLVDVEFDWHTATINLLTTDRAVRPPFSAAVKKRIREICDIQARSAGSKGTYYYCDQLGVPSSEAMPAHELGLLIEQNPEILSELYSVLNIRRRYMYNPQISLEENRKASVEFEKTYTADITNCETCSQEETSD